MSDFQFVKEQLSLVDLPRLRDLENSIKVPFGTLYKIRDGITKNPRVKTVEKIAKYFRGVA